jgi:pilus assembly protein CpaE
VPDPSLTSAAVVDDDAEARSRLCAMLESEGLAVVVSVPHGVTGVERVRAEAPQVIFVAFGEPVLRSVQTVDYLGNALPGSAILAYSSSEEVSVFQQAIRAGARHLLHAPLKTSDLRRALAAVAEKDAGLETVPVAMAGRVISVVGQKGGIGKTALSVNLASALAHDRKASVLIVDFDTSFGDVGLAMDMTSPSTTAQAALDMGKLDTAAFKESLSEHRSGAFVLSAPAHVGEWLHVRPAELEALVELGASLFDYVVVDTPGAYNDAVAAAVSVSDNLLIVTSLELSSVKNTSMLLAILEAAGYPEALQQVVVNNTLRDTGLNIADTVPALERQSMWNIPYDPAMRVASAEGVPVVLLRPDSPASQSIRALARRLTEEPGRIDRRRTLRAEAPNKRANFRVRLRTALSRDRVAAAG